MNNRHEVAVLVGAGQASMQFAQEHSDQIAALDRVVANTRRGLMVLGLASMTALTVMFFRPELTDEIKVMSPFWTESGSEQITTLDELNLPATTAAMATATESKNASATPSPAFTASSLVAQERVTGWLSKRHRVAGAASKMLVDAAFTTAQEADIDPLLILSVMSVQSRLNPFAENATGAHGLMQVITDLHRRKFDDQGGAKAIQDPTANLRVGALLLKESIRSTGSVEAGLKLYMGADDPRRDGSYASRVLVEYARLQAVASGRYVAATNTAAIPANATAKRIAEKSKSAGDQPA